MHYQLNLFRIQNLDNLNCEYRFYKLVVPPLDNRDKLLNLIKKELAFELQQPVSLVMVL